MSKIHINLLKHFNVYPKKSLGQNFLFEPVWVQNIVDAAQLKTSDVVLEIGSGTGVLTTELAKKVNKVFSIEIDDRLMPILKNVVSEYKNVRLIHGDVLEYSISSLLDELSYDRFVVVANIPYYITGKILRHIFHGSLRPSHMILLVQKEVAQRMAALPGQMSVLSVSAQFFSQVDILKYVPAGAFYPKPDVDSALIELDVFDENDLIHNDPVLYFRIVKAGFGQKRKQLQNSLTNGLGINKAQVVEVILNVGLDPKCRPQTLTLQDWSNLTNALVDLL